MIQFFEKVLGKENITIEKSDLEIYSTDSSQILGLPKMVCWPKDSQQIHQIILYSRRNKTTISPRGSGTNLVGCIKSKNSIILDLSQMDEILDKGKDYVTVEAGIKLKDLNEKIAPLYFPIVLANNDSCTIGGMISTNASGPESIKFGRMQDWVSEIEIIDGSGRIKKIKHNFCGLEGQTGIIITAKLKVLPQKPEYVSMDVLKFHDYESLLQKTIELKQDKEIILLELINHKAAKITNLSDTNYLIVVYTSEKGDTKTLTEIQEVINLRHSIPDKLYLEGYRIEEDIQISHENMVEFLYWLDKNDIPVYGHIGVGGLHPTLKRRTYIKNLITEVQRLGGEFNFEYGIGTLKKQYQSETIKQELLEIKKRFDPFNIINTNMEK